MSLEADTRWFKHMTDASRDERMVALKAEWGREGYSRWWEILELIAEQMDETEQCEVHYRPAFIARSLGFRSLIDCRSFVHWLAINGLLIVDLRPNEWVLKCPKLLKIRARKKLIESKKTPLEVEVEVEVDKEEELLKATEEQIGLFWKEYQNRNGTKGSKKKAYAEWLKLTPEEQEKAPLALEAQKRHYASCKLQGLFVPEFPDCWRWLRDKRFNDEIEIPKTWDQKFLDEMKGNA